jgi:hypothetical protein
MPRDLQMLLTLHVLLQYLPRDPFANNSPKRLFKGFVSLGKTKSVSIVKDSEGYFDSYFK